LLLRSTEIKPEFLRFVLLSPKDSINPQNHIHTPFHKTTAHALARVERVLWGVCWAPTKRVPGGVHTCGPKTLPDLAHIIIPRPRSRSWNTFSLHTTWFGRRCGTLSLPPSARPGPLPRASAIKKVPGSVHIPLMLLPPRAFFFTACPLFSLALRPGCA